MELLLGPDLSGDLADFLETAPDAMLLVAPDGRIASANDRAAKMFATDDLRGRSVDDLVPADMAETHAGHRAQFVAHPEPRVMGSGLDLVARRSDGSEFPVDVSLGTLDLGGERHVVAAVRDVTEQVEAQRALASSAFIVESSHDAIYVLDSRQIVTGWNRAAERLTGRRSADMIGREASHPLGLVDPELESRLIGRASSGEPLDHYRTEIVRADGQRVPVSIALAAVRNPRGQVVGISGIARDITEEMLAQESLKEMQDRLAETQRLAHIGLWAYDVQTGEVQWSEGLHQIAQVSPLDFGGDLASHLAIIGEEDRARVEEALAASVAERSPFRAEYPIIRPDGERRWITTSGDVTLRESGDVMVQGICQDLTDRQLLVDKLREADKLKDQFLGVVSHELRTPLTSILGFSQLIRDEVDGTTRTWADVVVRNADEMHGMVERILDYSRVHAGALRLTLAAHRAEEVVGEVMALVAAPLGQHVLETEIDRDVMIWADQNAVHRVLVNLLTNSAKFSPPGSTIRIEVTPGPGRADFRIHDQGSGIPADQVDAVFDRFHQVQSEQIATRHGVGVGLSIVKEYVEAMNGTVRVEHTSDAGTTILVELPVPA